MCALELSGAAAASAIQKHDSRRELVTSGGKRVWIALCNLYKLLSLGAGGMVSKNTPFPGDAFDTSLQGNRNLQSLSLSWQNADFQTGHCIWIGLKRT